MSVCIASTLLIQLVCLQRQGWQQAPNLAHLIPPQGVIWDENWGMSNDGGLIFAENHRKSLSVVDTNTGKPIWDENVFLCTKKSGGMVALTDSQYFHVKDSLDWRRYANRGKTLCAVGDGFLQFFTSDDSPYKRALGIVYPKKRGIDSNRILSILPSSFLTFASLDPLSPLAPIFGQWNGRQQAWSFQRYSIDTKKLRVASVRRAQVPVDLSTCTTDVPDVDWTAKRCLILGKTQTFWAEYNWQYRTTTTIPFPPATSTHRPYCYARYIGKALLAWFAVQGDQPAAAYMKRDSQSPWVKVGEFELVALSQDRKKAIVRTADRNLWLIPTSSLSK